MRGWRSARPGPGPLYRGALCRAGSLERYPSLGCIRAWPGEQVGGPRRARDGAHLATGLLPFIGTHSASRRLPGK